MDSLVKLFQWLCCCRGESSEDASIKYTTTTVSGGRSVHNVRIGAFNVQRFGEKKFNDAFVVDQLVKIIGRYDLLLIQEVFDEEEKHIPGFVDTLSKLCGKSFGYVVSERLGRGRYKEQYLYIYRNDVFEITDQYHYDDGSEERKEDTFMREPFILLLTSSKTAVGKIAVIGAHITPSAVEEELNEMVQVHMDVRNRWGSDVPVVIMGDFNAGGSYLSKKKLANLKLKTDDRYHWLIENLDTTVGKNDFTYDRIIVCGEELVACVVPGTANVFNFEEKFGLSKDEAQRISDHYPVEFVLGVVNKDEL